jgi:hypothetical protein
MISGSLMLWYGRRPNAHACAIVPNSLTTPPRLNVCFRPKTGPKGATQPHGCLSRISGAIASAREASYNAVSGDGWARSQLATSRSRVAVAAKLNARTKP